MHPLSIEKGMTLILSDATATSNREENRWLFDACFIDYAMMALVDHPCCSSNVGKRSLRRNKPSALKKFLSHGPVQVCRYVQSRASKPFHHTGTWLPQ